MTAPIPWFADSLVLRFWLGFGCGVLFVIVAFLALAAYGFARSDGSWFHDGVKL